MKCKFCNADMEEGSTVCPSCGKDNAAEETPKQETKPSTEKKPSAKKPEESEKKSGITGGKLALIIILALVAVAVVIALIYAGVDALSSDNTDPSDDTVAADTTAEATDGDTDDTDDTDDAEATVPTDGNPDDETCKGSYTVDDDTLYASKDLVIATVGDQELTVGMLQIYYWMSFYEFVDTYSYYLSYYGLDYTQALDTQTCFITGGTWQQYFLSSALTTWHRYQALSLEAQENGYTLDAEFDAYLEAMAESLEADALEYGFASAQEMLEADVGVGSTIADYLAYRRLTYEGYQYFDSEYQKISVTDEDVEAYFEEYEEELADEGITKDSGNYYSVRHILIEPEGGTTDDDGNTTYTDEEWEACLQTAQEILDEWLAGDATEDSFATLAEEYSTDTGSNTNGGLYSGLTEDTSFVTSFKEWYLDESRTVGDYDIIQSDYGYHIMYFSGSEPIWYTECQSALINSLANAIVTNCTDKYPITVSYSDIVLGYVSQTSES